MKHLQLVLMLCIGLSSCLSFGQNQDSLRQAMLERMKANNQFQQDIYKFKGKVLPEFALPLLTGDTLHSTSLKGKPTLINFWFKDCMPCVEEIPLLNEITSEFGDAVNFIAITFHDQEGVEAFLKRTAFNFTHVVGARDYIKTFGFFTWPKTLILDKDGSVTEVIGGIPKDPEAEEKNREALKNRLRTELRELL
ncbi:TlpA disulfide reductase family protein [Mangrovimonas sp. TPBH4]|uniref:TlpA family protein disulfide reductase n=1 Tax=Mangrovimonas sp. TPBH4 TaxID=1645914 RepID=UPI0006B5B2A9|nr:TlpA disulfide reductase family protein [Mangrovimonas sp. TPBH4]